MARQDNWENQWRQAFENQSVEPPADIWDGIAAELDRGGSKKRMLIIWLAAASISVFAATGVIYLETNRKLDLYKSSQVSQIESERLIKSQKQGRSETLEKGKLNELAAQEEGGTLYRAGTRDNDHVNGTDNSISGTDYDRTIAQSLTDSEITRKSTAQDNILDEFLPGFLKGVKEVAVGMEMPQVRDIWGVPMAYNSLSKKVKNSWYAGLDVATGSSSIGAAGESSDMVSPNLSSENVSAFNYNSSQIASTTMGVTVGKRIGGGRFIMESGLSYMRFNNSGSSNIAFSSRTGQAEAFSANGDMANSDIRTTDYYQLENVYQFISVPVKVGYLVVDSKWQVGINGGFSGDYFLRTFTEDLSGNLDRYETTPADNPQWNSFTFSMLGELNLSRQIGQNYNIAITPQVRQAFTDLSNTGTELRPLVFQLGLQFKYRFE